MHESPEVASLKRQIGALEREVANLGREVGRNDARKSGESRAVKDARWSCSKCHTLLAWWDPEKDVLRIRYKDHQVFARAGGVDPSKIVEAVLEAMSQEGVAVDESLAIKVAEHVAAAASMGFVQVICRGCGEVNTAEYIAESDIPTRRAV